MALQLTAHGTCCGANVIDGFHDQLSYKQYYLDNGYTEQQAIDTARGYPTREVMLRRLRELLTMAKNSKGQIMAILNQSQYPAWKDDLEAFGFQLVFSDVANPNHASNDLSRLFTFIRPQRPYGHGHDNQSELREAAGLGAPYEIPPIPEPPPPPPRVAQSIARANNLNYGRPL